MNSFDSFIINKLHSISGNSTALNDFMLQIVDNDFIKGGIVVSLLWFFWFRSNGVLTVRKKVISALFSCLVSIAVGRLLSLSLPFRIRPLLNPHFTFLFPTNQANWIDSASSMPSDHAVMFFALATGIFLISKKIGLLVYFYVSFFILFPRIYLGFHFPTDVLVGAALGTLIALIFSYKRICDPINLKVISFSDKHSGIFYLLFFWLTFQIGTMFNSSRGILHYLMTEMHHLI
jgi:undecaprenyl-diphosphatase